MRPAVFCLWLIPMALFAQPDEEMVTRVYRFSPPRWTSVAAIQSQNVASSDPFEDPFASRAEPDVPWARKTATDEDTRMFFTKTFGLEFPEGSWIHASMQGRLRVVMHNTLRQHARFRLMLMEMGELPMNIRIHTRLVAFDREALDDEEREKGRALEDAELHALWQEGRGETWVRQSVTVHSGVEAVLELGDEIRYPSRMVLTTNAPQRVVYRDFKTRRDGSTLNVTATGSPLDGEIRVRLSPETARHEGKNPDHAADLQPLTPIFESHQLETVLTVSTGVARVVSRTTMVSEGAREGGKEAVLFLVADLVKADGTRMKPADLRAFAPEE